MTQMPESLSGKNGLEREDFLCGLLDSKGKCLNDEMPAFQKKHGHIATKR